MSFFLFKPFQSPLIQLLDKLTPSDQERSKIEKTFKEIVSQLVAEHHLPKLSSPELFLAGSSYRETALTPVTHLNVLLVLDPSSLRINEQDLMVSLTGGDTFLEQLKDPSGLLQPVFLMKALLETLSQRFSATASPHGQALYLKLKNNPIEVHLTPAIPFANGYLIPEEKSELLWKKIDPAKEKEVIHKLNQRHSGNVIPTIRFMKYWNQTHNTDTFRSYHLEAIACLIFEEIPTPITSLIQALELYAKHMSKYIYNCPDPVRLSETIHRYLPDSIDQWYLFMNRIGELNASVNKGEKEVARFLEEEIKIAV